MRSRRDWLYIFILIIFALIFWAPALVPGKVLFLRDLASEIAAKRHFLTQTAGFHLWCPYIFLGGPFAANSQSEAFYPFNFFFYLFGAERGLTYYIIFHHLVFLLGFYAALRSLEYGEETALVGAVGLGFGGFVISLTVLAVLLSTVAWMPLAIICLNHAGQKNWLRWTLGLGMIFALQILAGEFQMAVMSWLLAICAVILGARKISAREFAKSLASLMFALLIGIIFSLPQIYLTAQMIPLSNRGGGMGIKYAEVMAVPVFALKLMVVPNFLLPPSAGTYWAAGLFGGVEYFMGLYMGASLLPFALFSIASSARRS